MSNARTANPMPGYAKSVHTVLRNDPSFFVTLLVLWIMGGYLLFVYTTATPRGEVKVAFTKENAPVEGARLHRRLGQLIRDARLERMRIREEETTLRKELPPLCEHWRPTACEAWMQETLALGARVRQRNDPAERRILDPTPRGVQLLLRGPQFRAWWPHVIGQIADSAIAKCPVPCDVRIPTHPLTGGSLVPLPPLSASNASSTELVLVDTLSPEPTLPLAVPRGHRRNASVAVVTLETGMGAGGHGRRSLRRTDWLVSWSRQSEVPINYMYAWHRICGVSEGAEAPNTTEAWGKALGGCMAPAPRTVADVGGRSRLAAVFMSNCMARERLRFLRELMRHLPEGSVESWGKCKRTPWLPHEAVAVRELGPRAFRVRGAAAAVQSGEIRATNKVALLANRGYKFFLALENSIHRDYVTEKALHPLLAAVVPVVWGAPEVADFMPGGPGSFINALDYESPEHLARHLLELDLNDTAYLSYFAWRRKPLWVTEQFAAIQSQSFTTLGVESWPCRLCQLIVKGSDGVRQRQ